MPDHLRRTCICCREEAQKGDLLRFVRQEGRVLFDSAQKLPGRGAYVHAQVCCWRRMGEVKRWHTAFGGKRGKERPVVLLALTKEDVERLMEATRQFIAGIEVIAGREVTGQKKKPCRPSTK